MGSVTKGRSPSHAITRMLQMLQRNMPLIVAGGLQPGLLFGPTRLNVADDPTRGVPLRAPSNPLPTWMEHSEGLELAFATAPGHRSAVGWVRLVMRLLPASS